MSISDNELKELSGLSDAEAEGILKAIGHNELPEQKKRGMLQIIYGVFKEPMFLLLVACGVIYLSLGDLEEAIMLLGFVFFIIGITIYQEGKTENALKALRDLSSPRALVIRGGVRKRIPGREVVPGDHIVLVEGDRIPADGIVIWCTNFSADESLLTGESVSVRKSAASADAAMSRPGGDDLPCVYSGSLVVSGQGVAVIKNTGIKTEMGKIGKALQSIEQEETLLQKETAKIVKTVFIVAMLCCVTVVLVYGFTRGDWNKSILSGITLAMAMLPEEFPVVLTVFLALGAWRISQKKVLARKITAVETLGAATVLCVDKTGTLTENKMSLRQIFASGKFYDIKENKGKDLPESYHKLIEYGILASQRDPFDPMEKALKNLGIEKLLNTEHMHEDWELVREYPLSSSLLSLSYVWKDVEKNEYIVGAKGAPEAILDLCHLYGEEKKKQMENVMLMAREGFRILGVASARSSSKDLPEKQHDFNYELLGFVGLEDPVRTEVPAAVKECYAAGIRIVMIKGDYQETAKNIGKQIGLKDCENVITGEELEKMPQEELIRRSKSTNIFARVVPEQKLLIVTAFKAAGEIVAMTGDGVNDAPALKASFIGIAMGERGTDVAREASSLVLLDDNFASIVEAIKVGRRIFDNLKKAMAYIVSVHIPIALMSLIPVLFQWKEMLLYPIHIVFLELIIDPACSIVFEREPGDKDIMQRKPRNPKERLFGKKTLTISVLQGLISFVIVMAVYKAALYLGESMVEIRTLCFITLIASNLMLIMTNRSWSKSILESFRGKNSALTWVVVAAVVFLMSVIYTPFLQKLFSFTAMKPQDFVIALCAGIAGVLWFELLKKVAKKYNFDLLKEKV